MAPTKPLQTLIESYKSLSPVIENTVAPFCYELQQSSSLSTVQGSKRHNIRLKPTGRLLRPSLDDVLTRWPTGQAAGGGGSLSALFLGDFA